MSAKTKFLKKIQARRSSPCAFESRSQADIADFFLEMEQLQERMSVWLEGTDVTVESISVSLTDLLVDCGAFTVPGIILRYENRAIKFTPLFLYGQGVTGCVEVSLYAAGKVTPVNRIFMRAGNNTGWRSTRLGSLSRPECIFDEDIFFEILADLIP